MLLLPVTDCAELLLRSECKWLVLTPVHASHVMGVVDPERPLQTVSNFQFIHTEVCIDEVLGRAICCPDLLFSHRQNEADDESPSGLADGRGKGTALSQSPLQVRHAAGLHAPRTRPGPRGPRLRWQADPGAGYLGSRGPEHRL